jgi:hypothetical protein
VSNVVYEDPTQYLVQVDNPDGTCPQVRGFRITGMKVSSMIPDPGGMGWGYDAMNELLDTGMWLGLEAEEVGTRDELFVNLRDSGGNGAFGNDQSVPGIDDFEQPAGDPANGDDDNYFAVEAIGCIQLTAGLHMIGVSSDDGTIIKIGGVEIGRAPEWKGDSMVDFLFNVKTAGLYSFQARMLEGGGGAAVELSEVLLDGTRVLLGDVEHGGSPVYVPEPATVALLGLGGLALLRRRR